MKNEGIIKTIKFTKKEYEKILKALVTIKKAPEEFYQTEETFMREAILKEATTPCSYSTFNRNK